jgi:hypothetical protein
MSLSVYFPHHGCTYHIVASRPFVHSILNPPRGSGAQDDKSIRGLQASNAAT